MAGNTALVATLTYILYKSVTVMLRVYGEMVGQVDLSLSFATG